MQSIFLITILFYEEMMLQKLDTYAAQRSCG
jgi:hypothetical protein